MVLTMMMMCCACITCCSIVCRLGRCKWRNRLSDRELYGQNQVAANDLEIMSENASRQSAASRRQMQENQRRMNANDRAEMRRKIHESVIDQYKKLIPVLKYKKSKEIDEFGTTECVICMDEFKNGTEIRKIPSCRHIFHSECIMKWLSGSNQMDQ